jgi:hypothetical protein
MAVAVIFDDLLVDFLFNSRPAHSGFVIEGRLSENA